MSQQIAEKHAKVLSFIEIFKANELQWHKFITRTMCLAFMVMFHAFFTRSYLEPIRYEIYTFMNLTPKSACLISGLWLSTTRLGARYRTVTSVLLLPSFGFLVFAFNDFGILVILSNIFWSYWIVLSQRRL
ncbi:MAG: hypothetical protein NT027_05635 [Proteobacteria bacterium]|nr:hypothetical protein [Pseudomonadota bacterium]